MDLLRRLPRPAPALLLALAGASLILALQALPEAPAALEYRRELLPAEPWRLIGAHFVHLGWPHALVNASAWLLLAWLFSPQVGARRQMLIILASAIFISVALWALHPGIAWYRGASGVLHALFFAATALGAWRGGPRPVSAWPLALAAAGWVKVLLELPSGDATPYAEWLRATTVPQAHFHGAIAGTVLGLLFVLTARRAPGDATRRDP